MYAQASSFVAILIVLTALTRFNQSQMLVYAKTSNILWQNFYSFFVIGVPASIFLAFNAGYR